MNDKTKRASVVGMSPPSFDVGDVSILDDQTDQWICYCFGMSNPYWIVTAKDGGQPKWLWRKLQFLLVGHRWEKIT